MTTTHSIESDGAGVEKAAITDASQTGLAITGSMTLMGWLRPSAIGRAHEIVAKWNTALNRSYRLFIESANRIRFEYSDNGTNAFFALSGTIASFAVDEWRHFAVVFISGTPSVEFYVDGLLESSPSIAGPGTVDDSSSGVSIGNTENGGNGDNFRGHLDQIKIYDDERTAAEIFAEYQEPAAAGANLQAGWNLDNDFTDISGNGNTLTNSGTSFDATEVHGYGQRDVSLNSLVASEAGGNHSHFNLGSRGLTKGPTIIVGSPPGLPQDIAGGFSVG